MISERLWRLVVLLLAASTLAMSVQEVIVVGGGLAGLCASIEAVLNGAHVTLIEKEDALGGNSAKATSGINGASTMYQEQHGIVDSYNLLEKDTLSSGGGLSNRLLVKTLASSSNDAIQFLSSFDIKLDNIVQLGGHSVARTHRFSPTKDGRPVPVGFALISRLKKHVETTLSKSVTVLLRRKFVKLIKNNGQVVGIKFASSDGLEKEIYGNVVLTAGGYGHDRSSDSILYKYVPHINGLPTTNGPWATGDIFKATLNDNLSLIHMDKVQIHPTSFLDPNNVLTFTKFLAPEALRGCGGILINLEGKRFVNELGRRDHVTNSIFGNCGYFENNIDYPKTCIMLFNEEVVKKFGAGIFNFYKSRGLIQDIGDLDVLSKKLNIDISILNDTINNYKQYSLRGLDNFDKSVFPVSFELNDHFYVSYITPAIHYCMGGLQINENSQVLSSIDNQPIKGLFAAGEVTGGVHGENRLGGNSLLECVVFGRIAGKGASEQTKVVHEEM